MELVSLDLQPSWDIYVEKVLGYEFAQWDMHAQAARAKINDARGTDLPPVRAPLALNPSRSLITSHSTSRS